MHLRFGVATVEQTQVTLLAAMSACESGGRWAEAVALLEDTKRAALEGPLTSEPVRFSAERNLAATRALRQMENAALSACEKGGAWVGALGVLARLQRPDLVSFCAALRALDRAGVRHEAVEAAVRAGAAEPVTQALRVIATREDTARKTEAEESLAVLGGGTLESVLTAEVLDRLGFAERPLLDARRAVARALAGVAPGTPLRAGLVVCWVRAVGTDGTVLHPGLLVREGGYAAAAGALGVGEPGVADAGGAAAFIDHDRTSHAERQALLAVHAAGGAASVVLHAAHTPCVSCLAACAHFAARAQRDSGLRVSFVTWEQSLADAVAITSTGALTVLAAPRQQQAP